MRKVIIIVIAAVLLLGVSGCKSGTSAQDTQTMIDIANAGSIVNAINAYNALNPGSALPDNVTLDDAKSTLSEKLWPKGISDEDAKEACKWITIKNGKADLTPEAQEVWDKSVG
jgi:hypothetical protein